MGPRGLCFRLRFDIGGFLLVEMAISTNSKPTIYRKMYENTGVWYPSKHKTSTQGRMKNGPRFAMSFQPQPLECGDQL